MVDTAITMPQLIRKAFDRGRLFYGAILKVCFVWLLLLWLAMLALATVLMAWVDPKSSEGPLLTGLIMFQLQLLESSVITMIVPKAMMDLESGRRPRHLLPHFRQYFGQVCIEVLRAMGRIMAGIVLLVIPGLVLQFRYYFVPYIVQFDPAYDRGQADALKRSSDLYAGRGVQVAMAVAILWLGFLSLDLGLQSLQSMESIKTFGLYLNLSLGLLVQVFLEVCVFSIYLDLSRTEKAL